MRSLKGLTMSKRMIDLIIYMDGLTLDEGESAEDVVNYLKEKYELPWEYVYEVTYEETVDD